MNARLTQNTKPAKNRRSGFLSFVVSVLRLQIRQRIGKTLILL